MTSSLNTSRACLLFSSRVLRGRVAGDYVAQHPAHDRVNRIHQQSAKFVCSLPVCRGIPKANTAGIYYDLHDENFAAEKILIYATWQTLLVPRGCPCLSNKTRDCSGFITFLFGRRFVYVSLADFDGSSLNCITTDFKVKYINSLRFLFRLCSACIIVNRVLDA